MTYWAFILSFEQFMSVMFKQSSWRQIVNPSTPYVKGQILPSCPYTFLIKVMGRSCYISEKIHLG